jgi:hypothetical protein
MGNTGGHSKGNGHTVDSTMGEIFQWGYTSHWANTKTSHNKIHSTKLQSNAPMGGANKSYTSHIIKYIPQNSSPMLQ